MRHITRDQQIEAIVSFVGRHPESLASRTIVRATGGTDEDSTGRDTVLGDRLRSLDEETLNGYYYMVK